MDLDLMLKRAVAEIIVREELEKLLKSDKKLRLKEGFDPSKPDIHLGHMVGLRKLRQFQELGHQVVLIVGDWTARIGDPSGASATRPMLSAEEVRVNAQTYMEQFFKVVDKNKTELRLQSEWFDRFTLADVIRLTSRFTVAQFLARDDFSKRYSAGKPIAITELLYPLLQAYDSVAIQSDVEFGGTDQKFNLLVGRELQSMIGQHPQQCFMTPLLVGTDGSQKMSKSLGNYIGIAEPPEEIFGKVMSIKDSLVMEYFELLTDVPDKELAEFRQAMDSGTVNPMELKKRLASEILVQLYSPADAAKAQEHFERVFQKREAPEEIPEVKLTPELLQKIKARSITEKGGYGVIKKVGKPEEAGTWFVSVSLLLIATGLAKSRSDAKRLIKQESVQIDDETIHQDEEEVGAIKIGSVIKVGKRRWMKIVTGD